ncbi:flagellar motor switch protein FliN [Pilimelia columellifera]|uniref:Flagellar motor switch protein FliN-like C-terminal domain-containing protein n=1 Tax=Pilimelia columellifera subsp. columellifera TaxID=706583 RepID=A0ABN3N8H0_9ACTN
MTTTTLDSRLGQARDAADAALSVLPVSAPLVQGEPTTEVPQPAPAGQAVTARFTGTVSGEIAIVAGQDLVDALSSSPLGELDLTAALRPALEAAAGAFGPVVVDPGQLMEPEVALSGLVSKNDAIIIPLTEDGQTRAAIALRLDVWPGAAAEETAGPSRPAPVIGRGLDLLHDVEMEVSAELGRTRMSVRELLSLTPGAVVELDRAAGSPADLLVNGRLIARGEVVVVDENFGLRVTEIIAPNGGER